MKIIDALKNDNVFDIRISHGDKWMIWDLENDRHRGVWKVYQRKYGAKKTQILIATDNEEHAIEKLLEG